MEIKTDALLVIDMLNDFCDPKGSLFVPANLAIIPNIAREINRARERGTPVIYVCDRHPMGDIEFRNWPAHAVPGTWGAEIIDELKPAPGDVAVSKHTLLIFHETELEDVLRGRGVTSLIITGCLTNICVMYGATEAVVRGYRVKVPRDCVAAVDPTMHEFALRQMAEVLKAEIV